MTVPLAASLIYHFGEFELDAACRELRRNGVAIELPSKPFSCVLYLIENRHRVVDRDELMRAVWGHVHLTDSVLGQAIRHARQVLGDSGEDQRVIKTVRGFGYRWAARVDAGGGEFVLDAPRAAAKTAIHTRARRPLVHLLFALAALAAVLIPASSERNIATMQTAATNAPTTKDAIALLLPVAGASGADDAWIRLGLMEYIANRLRTDGQPMVPTDTVILLLHGAAGATNPGALQSLSASTQARVIVEAEAQRQGTTWRVSLHSVGDTRPTVSAVGEDADILAAARVAADNIAISLGRVPIAAPDATPDLTLLEQRINAAMLTQNRDLARRLIENAPPALRASTEIRFQLARIDFYDRDAAKAEAAFQTLLSEVSAEADPILRARVLNGLGVMHATRGERAVAEPMLEDAVRLLEHHDTGSLRDTQGTIWMNLGNIAQERGDLDLASERMAHARRMFEATGDVRNLAQLELNVGVLETRRERFADALRRFDHSARLHAAIQNTGDELKALCYVVQVQLRLLDPAAAEPHVARVSELLQTTTNPELIALAKLSLSELDYATGRDKLASRLLDEIVSNIETGADLPLVGMDALADAAERAMDAGDAATAKRIAIDLAARVKSQCSDPEAEDLDRARLVLVRIDASRRNIDAASKTATEMAACAGGPSVLPRMHAALAEAEVAAAANRPGPAATAFERALALADESRTPAHLLQVTERYADWLLARPGDEENDERLLRVSERIAGFAERDYAAALIQLRVYRRLGPPAAWQTALARTQRLAGERRIPADLVPAT